MRRYLCFGPGRSPQADPRRPGDPADSRSLLHSKSLYLQPLLGLPTVGERQTRCKFPGQTGWVEGSVARWKNSHFVYVALLFCHGLERTGQNYKRMKFLETGVGSYNEGSFLQSPTPA